MKNFFRKQQQPAKIPQIVMHPKLDQLLKIGEMELVWQDDLGYSYYRMVNEQRIPALRAMAAKDVWQELEHRIPRQVLEGYFQSIMDLTNKGQLAQIAVLTEAMQERSSYITHVGLLYKLATVLYFDQTENPLDYDPVYAYEKMKRWQESRSVDAFFLETPMIEFLPFSDLSSIDLNAYTKAQNAEEIRICKAILKTLSEESKNADTGRELQLLTAALQTWQDSTH